MYGIFVWYDVPNQATFLKVQQAFLQYQDIFLMRLFLFRIQVAPSV